MEPSGRDDLAVAAQQRLTTRAALRGASPFPIARRVVRGCVKLSQPADALFERARIHGLDSIERSRRSGHLARVIGEVAESVAQIVLGEQGYNLFWQITTPGIHGVDLLFLSPDESLLELAAAQRAHNRWLAVLAVLVAIAIAVLVIRPLP